MNLDTFNSGYAALDNDQERAEFVSGLYKGMNGGKIKDDCSDPMSVGFAIGQEMRLEAEGFRERSVKNGGKRKSNRNDQMVDHKVYQTVDQTCTQSTIPNPQTTNPQPKTTSPLRARQSRKKDESIPLPEDLVPVVDYLISNWPPVSYEKGSSRSVQIYMREDLWARVAHLASRFGKVPGAVLFCGLPYVRRILKDSEDTRKPVYVKNMSNFWGIKEDNRAWEEAYNQGLVDYNKFKEKDLG